MWLRGSLQACKAAVCVYVCVYVCVCVMGVGGGGPDSFLKLRGGLAAWAVCSVLECVVAEWVVREWEAVPCRKATRSRLPVRGGRRLID